MSDKKKENKCKICEIIDNTTKWFKRTFSEEIQYAKCIRPSISSSLHSRRLQDSLSVGWNRTYDCFTSSDNLISLGVGSLTGMSSFTLSRYICTCLTFSLRISSYQRYRANILGLTNVIVSSAIAANVTMNVSSSVYNYRMSKQGAPTSTSCFPFRTSPWWPIYRSPSVNKLQTFDSSVSLYPLFIIVSLISFYLFGGRPRLLSPSDIFRKGSFAVHWIPAHRAQQYADVTQKRLLNRYGNLNGCHTCGIRRQVSFIGDHIPPNKFNQQLQEMQIFLPQCSRCSLIQSTAVRINKRVLVLPRRLRKFDIWLPWPVILLPLLPAAALIGETTNQCVELKR